MFQVNNQKGFSGLNLMVGVFFLGLVVFLVMHTIKKQADSLNDLTAEAEIEVFLGDLKRQLSSAKNCNATLSKIQTNNGQVTSMKFYKGDELIEQFALHTTIGASETKILKYSTSIYNNFDEDIAELGMINLIIELQKDIESQSAAKVSRSIKLYIREREGRIEECAFGGLPKGETIQVQESFGTRLSSPFVGVNTSEMKTSLNIGGSLQLTPSDTPCSQENIGAIQFSGVRKQFEQCKRDLTWKRVHR
ncbi:hypothetical protein BIY24_08030 [Halobacteriovorax marinus]|uniref:hypothetical protein n=1 Tax=Halobacteriovorax marinus TaxID=97084 RepID=UPI000BC361DD|nr:hypothetical protein [Halobacteriovorax marinus]ATH07898.1 hypothetical protein BIY24_08030 [Halobacteriovorax marinus]